MYHRVFHHASGPVHPCSFGSNNVSSCTGPAYGCKGLASLRSSPPCPWPFPCHSARTSRDTDAELKPKGKGSAPAPAASRALAVLCFLFRLFYAANPPIDQGRLRGLDFCFVPSFCMEAKKGKGLLELAYAPPGKSAKGIPGPWFDVGVVALLVFGVISYIAP